MRSWTLVKCPLSSSKITGRQENPSCWICFLAEQPVDQSETRHARFSSGVNLIPIVFCPVAQIVHSLQWCLNISFCSLHHWLALRSGHLWPNFFLNTLSLLSSLTRCFGSSLSNIDLHSGRKGERKPLYGSLYQNVYHFCDMMLTVFWCIEPMHVIQWCWRVLWTKTLPSIVPCNTTLLII